MSVNTGRSPRIKETENYILGEGDPNTRYLKIRKYKYKQMWNTNVISTAYNEKQFRKRVMDNRGSDT